MAYFYSNNIIYINILYIYFLNLRKNYEIKLKNKIEN